MDTGVRRRCDMDAEDVAQDVALQFDRMEPKPRYWKGWTRAATRHRLIDLARQRQQIPVGEDELFRRIQYAVGPSAWVIAKKQWQEVFDVLGPKEFHVLNDHLAGATNPQIAERHDYASAKVVASILHRIRRKLRSKFPDLRVDLEPQRMYQVEPPHVADQKAPRLGPWFDVHRGDPGSAVLLHVPHSSRTVPDRVRSSIVLDNDDLAQELNAMTDAYTDLTAGQVCVHAGVRPWQFVNRTSRLVVDPERFPDEREEMARVGMAAVYTKTSTGERLRRPDPSGDQRLLAEFFTPYSDRLADEVDGRLSAVGRAIILDLHSYPLHALPYELHQDEARPEICLGVDESHTPDWLVKAAQSALSIFGAVSLNQPFAGTYIPLKHYGSDHRVSSLMIEIRRDVFTELDGSPDRVRIARLGAAIAALVDQVSSPPGS